MQPSTPADLLRRWRIEGPRPRTLQAVVEWVAAALRTQRPEDAVALLRSLLEAREDPVLWGYLAQAETAAGRPDRAKALAERADPAELKAFLLQRLKQDTGKTLLVAAKAVR